LLSYLACLGACDESLTWYSHRIDLEPQFWPCEHPEWLVWLCSQNIGVAGWPTTATFLRVALSFIEASDSWREELELKIWRDRFIRRLRGDDSAFKSEKFAIAIAIKVATYSAQLAREHQDTAALERMGRAAEQSLFRASLEEFALDLLPAICD
jgi:hypothetical protein